jgi:NRPS condensation-like uncharacterized protein
MAKPKASLTAALAQKHPSPPAAAEPAPAPKTQPPKVDDGSIKTSLVIQRDDLAELKALALKRRVTVNDLILEFIANGLALNGRRTAA